MAIPIQHRRGTTSQNGAFLGLSGEIVVDTQVKTIRVHDGAQLGGFALPVLHSRNKFTAGQRVETRFDTTDNAVGGTYTVNLELSNNFEINLKANITLDFSNLGNGQSGVVTFTQDVTGGRTVAYNSKVKFPGGTAPTAAPGTSAVSVLGYYVQNSSTVLANMLLDFS